MFDAIPTTADIAATLTGVQMPRMNAVMERWVQTCRLELLDRTLIWNQQHLLRALREFEHFYNQHRLHRGIANARPPRPLPAPIPTSTRPLPYPSADATASAASCMSTNVPLDLLERRFRQEQGRYRGGQDELIGMSDTDVGSRKTAIPHRAWPA